MQESKKSVNQLGSKVQEFGKIANQSRKIQESSRKKKILDSNTQHEGIPQYLNTQRKKY